MKKLSAILQALGFIILMLIPLTLIAILFKPLIIEGIYHLTLIGYK